MNFWDLLIDQYCHSRYLFSLMVFCLNTDFTKKFPPNCNWNWFKKSHQKSRKISNHNIAQYAFKCEFCFFYFWSKPKSNLKFLATPSISMLDPLSFSNKNKNIWEQWHNLWFWKKKKIFKQFWKTNIRRPWSLLSVMISMNLKKTQKCWWWNENILIWQMNSIVYMRKTKTFFILGCNLLYETSVSVFFSLF